MLEFDSKMKAPILLSYIMLLNFYLELAYSDILIRAFLYSS